MDSRFKRLSKWATKEAISNLVWSYWPHVGAPVVMGTLTYLEGRSFDLIFLMSLGAFAAIAHGLNQFSQWQGARSPADKIRFASPVIGPLMEGSPAELTGIKLGVSIQNAAQFPIEVRLDDLETQISDRVPSEPFFIRSLELPIAGIGTFTNSVIKLDGEELKNEKLISTIKAKISYGRPGQLKYSAEQSYWLALKFNKRGQFEMAEVSTTELKVT